MKTKEEIEQLANEYANGKSSSDVFKDAHKNDFIKGYTQCQNDMTDEMIKLKNAVQLSVDLLCEADEEIALLKEQLLGFQNP